MVSSIYKIFPGIIFCFVIAYSGIYLSDFIGIEILNLKKSPISPIIIAIILGLFVSNSAKNFQYYSDGYTFSIKYFLVKALNSDWSLKFPSIII